MTHKKKNKKIITIFLPIRKGSKRVVKKNTKKIYNFKLGLTEIKILQLKELRKKFRRDTFFKNYKLEFVLSTNIDLVKKFTKNKPWLILHNRQNNLAKDDCLDDLITEVPKICSGDFILWTHVTSPMFKSKDYFVFLKTYFNLLKNKRYDSSFTVDVCNKFLIDDNNKWISHNQNIKKWPRTQDLKKIFSVNSAAFLSSRKNYLKYKDRIGVKPYPHISSPLSGYDIDTEENFTFYKKYLIKNDD
jgi:CMP-N-acetylneuraminic acid synthetase